ncbi:MAG: aminotransferase class V-fold PLP-dependent enzyme [Verrucomicrobiaceae bacterium]|nr:aminotransferase class V-fold PLP-dependent enzyme [Verrucomicrobiaceae bacterium]
MIKGTQGYFDWNATTPLRDVARDAWLSASSNHWQNASSLYHDAGMTAQRLDAARERLADLLGCEAERIVFTSGATEANNMLHAALARRTANANRRALVSSIEHPSVREPARKAWGANRLSELPVDGDGVLDISGFERQLAAGDVGIVSVISASNESGVLQPWAKTASLCKQHGVPFHTDATQWIGKLPSEGLAACDYVTGSGHKFGGPKGTGFLIMSDPDEKLTLLHGGPQENGQRAGTENYPGIEAMVCALEEATEEAPAAAGIQAQLRDQFEETMRGIFPGLKVISAGADRLWNTSLMAMPAHSNLKWLTRLSRRGFSISTGSACSSGREGSSVIVSALGASPDELRRVVRVSAGWDTTAEAWAALAAAFAETYAELASGAMP